MKLIWTFQSHDFSGENETNELGRNGKRSLLQRVDAVETSLVNDASAGLDKIALFKISFD